MALYRPAIPAEVKVRVLLRQIGEMFPEQVVQTARRGRSLERLQKDLLTRFAETLACEVKDLRLDHDPALGLRARRGEGKSTTYTPDANDPEYLAYRPHGAQFAGSHDVKTRIRGDHGQFSDITLIKRERRREKKKRGKLSPKAKMPSRSRFGAGKTRWQNRPFPKRRKP